uniref:Uncharacterized protein n=1 Tax=Amphimedon queenslandica TaxID=400682 RepID=A0A1X7VGN3_AMPQE
MEQISRNSHYIKSILEVLLFCATQEIALRGHREVASKNKGNFLTIPSSIKQNELLNLLTKNVQKVICSQVRNAGYYSIIVDECRDLAKREQLSFCVPYVNVADGIVNQRYLGFSHAKDLDATSLTGYIKELGYERINVMSGHCSGVQTKEISVSHDAAKAIEARGLYRKVQSLTFLVSLVTFDHILTCTKQLSDQLQSSSSNLSSASHIVVATKSFLSEYGIDDY